MKKVINLEAERTKRNIKAGKLITKLPGDDDTKLRREALDRATRLLCLVCPLSQQEIYRQLQSLFS